MGRVGINEAEGKTAVAQQLSLMAEMADTPVKSTRKRKRKT
ncbi:MAG: hypothetical protein M5U34_35035 [Chloroflexi bacterium]|nr:hypothetical protein [Chloroflexota bacterium]